MDEEIDFLLLNPFNEIVEKAQAAIDKAQDVGNTDMLKAAQSLMKEGERAQKALDPIARRQLALYGENFVSALKDHDGIAEHIDALNDLVYVFDDYTGDDSFDAEKFEELGKLAKQATPRITAILRRMKLEAPSLPPPASTPSTPLLPTVSPFTMMGVSRVNSVGEQSTTSNRSSVAAKSPRPDDAELLPPRFPSIPRSDTVVHVDFRETEAPVMGTKGGPDLGWNNGLQSNANATAQSPSRSSVASTLLPSVPAPPPPVPATNPWQVGARPLVDTIVEEREAGEAGGQLNDTGEGDGIHGADAQGDAPERRRRVSSRPDSPTLPSPTTAVGHAPNFPLPMVPPPPPPTSSFSSNSPRPYVRRLDDGVDAWQRQVDGEERRLRDSTDASPRTVPLRPEPLSSPPVNMPVASATWSLPSQQSPPAQNNIPPQQQRQSAAGPTSTASLVSPRGSQISTITTSTATSSTTTGSVFSFDSYYNGLSNQMRESGLDPISPVAGPTANPVSPDDGPSASFASARAPLLPAPPPSAPEAPQVVQQMPPGDQPGLEIIQPIMDIDPGLIPVESPVRSSGSIARSERALRPRPADCNIGPSSSFHLLRGFCEGAKEVQRGSAGVRQVKKLSYSGGGAFAAKCTHCFYELQWAEVEKDRQNQPSANYRMHNIGFRLRFLSKSHLPAKQVDDPLYACLFCLQEGRTLEESDATVFFSQAQLFSHLSRHPRPLPNVPGVTVIEGPERPQEIRNNYDLQFLVQPASSELDGIRRELQQLPTGTAVETFRMSHGTLRRASDGATPLQFPAGAKIVGIEYPARYKGEWGVGWFDNVRGPFPVEAVRLDPPPRNEMRTQGTSSMRATVRWKWATSSSFRNTDWLRLDKNETVTNIIWSHPEHWCWACTNSRGKWGYFPQSHIEPNSLKEDMQMSDGASVASQKQAGFLTRLRSHNNHNNTPSPRRPVSIASQSTSSSR